MPKINLSPLLKEAPKTHQPQSPERQGLIRQINNLSSNIGGPELIQLLTMLAFLMVLANCEGCKKGINLPIPDASTESVPDGLDSNEQIDHSPVIFGISPEYDQKRYHVLGKIPGGKIGDTANLILVFEKDGKIFAEVEVTLTAVSNRGTASGKANIDPKSVEGDNSVAYVKGEKDPSKRMKLIP